MIQDLPLIIFMVKYQQLIVTIFFFLMNLKYKFGQKSRKSHNFSCTIFNLYG